MSQKCNNCSKVVSSDFVRVFADNSGEVHYCLHCRGRDAILRGAVAGKEVPQNTGETKIEKSDERY